MKRDPAASEANTLRLDEMFEQQVERTPEAVAVVYEQQTLSYGELNRRANQLAHHLRGVGVGAETVVGLCVERSLEMIVGLLGVVKAGAAYLPLDPTYPQQRLEWMMADSGAGVMLTQEGLVGKLAAQGQVICLDRDWPLMAQEQVGNPIIQPNPANLVYVIYTSGSTGRPKGVAIEHQQLANYTRAITDLLALPPGAHFALLSSFAADLGNTVLFPSLCSGGALHLIPHPLASDPQALADYFAQYSIDCLKITPSHLAALMDGPTPQSLLPNEVLVVGGEASRWEWIEQLQQLSRGCAIINHYGPTETTVGALSYRVEREARWTAGGSVPIGRPLANTAAYILDEQQEVVAVGVVGELYIGGSGVGRGYHNGADATAEKFTPDGYGGCEGSRMYRSGDKTRRRADGEIEYIGRVDEQVKVRGYRVEIGEIEEVMRQQRGVKECVVVAREEERGEQRLIGYVVWRGEEEMEERELRERMREKLPEYMMPSAYVKLEKLPLTGNGKIDRRALPEPERTRPNLSQPFLAPRNPMEEALASIWTGVLGVERVGIHDSFLELGGHSLTATQMVSRVRKILNIELSLSALFESPTIASLGLAITHHQQQKQSVLSPINKVNHSGDEDLLSDLNLLSEEEINSMLVSMSSESGVEK